jgi:hypothetical protein
MPDYQLATRRAARKFGVNEGVLLRLIRQESGFNPNARSPAGAQGIAQFMEATAPSYGVNLHDNRVTDDLEGAAKYIRAGLDKYGSYTKALSVYNSGRPDGYKSIPETANYVRSILGGHEPSVQRSSSGGSQGSQQVNVSASVPQSAPSFDPGQAASTLQGLLTQQQAPPVQIPQAPHGVVQAPVVNAPAADSGIGALLAAAATPVQGLPEVNTTPTARVSVSGSVKAPTASLPAAHGKSKLLELFYNGPGGINAKNGVREPKGFVSGHTDHVHVAAGPKTVVALGQLAEQMGLHVGENPHFGGVHPVHVKNSNHYKGEAIDVSGTPAQMEKFNHRVASIYGLGR